MPPEDKTVVAPAALELECGVMTDEAELPELVVSWMRDDTRLTGDMPGIQIDSVTHSLRIGETVAADSGLYRCMASNGIDSAVELAQVTVKGLVSYS